MKEKKLALIEKTVDNFFNSFHIRPQLLGTIEDIEAIFFIIDPINFILKYETEIDHKELSWQSFLVYKGLIHGSNISVANVIKNEKDQYNSLKKLRKEYDEWVDMKMQHCESQEDSQLLNVLENCDEREAKELLSWFTRYSSNKSIMIYSNIIKNDYFSSPSISVGLAKMGDKNVLSWAIKELSIDNSFEKRRVVIECIACSPHNEADEIINNIILNSQISNIDQVDDIECLAGILADSVNEKKFERLEQIITQSKKSSTLKTILELSIRKLMYENKEKALELLNKIE